MQAGTVLNLRSVLKEIFISKNVLSVASHEKTFFHVVMCIGHMVLAPYLFIQNVSTVELLGMIVLHVAIQKSIFPL